MVEASRDTRTADFIVDGLHCRRASLSTGFIVDGNEGGELLGEEEGSWENTNIYISGVLFILVSTVSTVSTASTVSTVTVSTVSPVSTVAGDAVEVIVY